MIKVIIIIIIIRSLLALNSRFPHFSLSFSLSLHTLDDDDTKLTKPGAHALERTIIAITARALFFFLLFFFLFSFDGSRKNVCVCTAFVACAQRISFNHQRARACSSNLIKAKGKWSKVSKLLLLLLLQLSLLSLRARDNHL